MTIEEYRKRLDEWFHDVETLGIDEVARREKEARIAWRKAHPRPIKLTSIQRLRSKVIEHLGSKCAYCGYLDIRALQLDHVNGDGAEHRKRKSPYRIMKDILAGRGPKMQLLCANCNWIKGDLGEDYKPFVTSSPAPSAPSSPVGGKSPSSALRQAALQ